MPTPTSTSLWFSLYREVKRRLLHPTFLIFHGLTLALLGIAWVFDEQIYCLCNAFYNGPKPLNGELHQIILSMAMYGQTLGILMAIVLILLFDVHHRGRAVLLAVVLSAAGLGSSAVKMMVGRERPLDARGATILQGPHKGLTQSRNQSLPSGHTTTAFAMSYALSRCYPGASMLVWSLAGGVGLNRILTVRHFTTDVLVGAWLGLFIAAVVYRLKAAHDLRERVDRALAPNPNVESCLPAWRFDEFETWRRIGRRLAQSPLLLLAVSLAIHFVGNGQTTLWDRDEPRFATATREMAARGDWIVPTFNGELRPDKPILIYWLMGGAYRILGDNPFAARFISGLAGTTSVAIVFLLGRSMFGFGAGLVAGWILALSPMLVIESKLATVDALLLALMTSAMACLWRLRQQSQPRWAYLFWVSVSLAILAKGPVALAIVFGSLGLFCAMIGEWRWLNRLCWLRGLMIAMVLIAPWCVLVQRATDGDFLGLALGYHVLRRAAAPLENHRGFPGYYLLSLVGLMAPWAWLLPWSIRRLAPQWRDPAIAFLFAWSAAVLLLFEVVSTKLVHYALPAYPALSLLIGGALMRNSENPGYRVLDHRLGRILIVFGWVAAPVGVALALILLPIDAAQAAAIAALVLTGGAVIAGMLLNEQSYFRSMAVMASTMAASMLILGGQCLPVYQKQLTIHQAAERLKEYGKQHVVALWLYRDPSLVYQLGRVVPVVDPLCDHPLLSDSLALARREGSFICPMTTDHHARMSLDPTLSLEVKERLVNRLSWGKRKRDLLIVEVKPSPRAREIEWLIDSMANFSAPGAIIVRLLAPPPETRAWGTPSTKKYPINPVLMSAMGRPGLR